MVPSSRGKRWTIPDNSEDASAVLDVASSGKAATSEELAQIAAFAAPLPPIKTDGNDFSTLHAFHRSNSNVIVGNSPAKTILLSIRSEIRKEESVLAATRKYLGPNGCLSFLVVQTIASLEQKAKGIDADGDGKVDLNELREFLSEAGALDIFGVNSAQEVMSIFDTDGNGTLEPEEMACLMEFIEEEKTRLLELGGNKDSSTRENAVASAGAMKKRRGSLVVSEKKLATISKLEQSVLTADQDGDGIVDLEELRAFLQVSGAASFFGASGAEEVMKIFDSDGNGYLDADEFRELKEFIETEKRLLMNAL